jgi:putative membrane protein
MHPIWRALLSGWEWRPVILTVLLLMGALYLTGWRRLRTQSRNPRLASRWRLAAYGIGWVTLAIALMSPVDALGSHLFFMHMVQHLLLTMVAAPLLWLGAPFPIGLWGLPPQARDSVARWFAGDSAIRRGLAKVTSPIWAWCFYVAFLVGWHDPTLYSLAQGPAWVHDLEHLTMFGSGLLFWKHAVAAAPRIHGAFPIWARMIYLVATVVPNMATGVVLALSQSPIYPYYQTVPRLWGFTIMQDQQIAGAIMWIPGSMMYILAAVIALGVWSEQDKRYSPKRREAAARPKHPDVHRQLHNGALHAGVVEQNVAAGSSSC